MSLNVQVWALGTPDLALPDLGDYSVTPIAGDVGSISIDYPVDGHNFAALRRLVDDDVPVEIEVRTDGTSATALRYLLVTASGDDVKPGSVWTFTGYDLGHLVRAAVTTYNTSPASSGTPTGDTVFSATAGVIVRTLMQQAQARGALSDVTFASFSNTLDSNGASWALTAKVSLSPGRNLADILSTTLAAAGLCEWEITAGRELRLYNAGTRGVDRSIPGPTQLTLEHGRDIADAPVRHDLTDVATTLTASGKDGIYSSASNATALARLGRRIEQYSSYGSIADQGSLDAATQLGVSVLGDGMDEQTHALILEAGSTTVPGRDFGLSDWVLRGVRGTTQRRRVVRYTLSRSGRELSAAVTLGDLIAARAVRVQRAIDALAGGDTVVGTSTLPAQVDDGKTPAAPTGLVATSAAYYDGGTPLAQVTASWLPVTTNADGTAIDDLSGYQVEYRYQAGQGLPTTFQIAGLTSATTLLWSPVVQGKAVDVRVAAYDRYNRLSAYSAVYAFTTGTDAAAPPTPATPTVSAYLGLLKVDWTGRDSGGAAQPIDFREVEVHLSTASGFTPSRPLLADGRLDTGASTTYRDRLTGAGELPVAPGGAYGVTWYAKLVAVDKSNNASAASAQGSAVLVQAADGDVSALNVGKLVTGIMSALLTISGIIRTATSGARVELDTTGLRCISSTGAVLFEFHIPTSVLTLVGRLIAGAGVGVGATIDIDPSAPRINWYPDATTARIDQQAFVAALPDGGSGTQWRSSVRNAAGQTSGGFIAQWVDGVFLSMLNTAGVFVGGVHSLDLTSARLQARNSGGAVASQIIAETNGNITLDTNGGDFTLDADGGELRFKGQFQNFVAATTDQAIWCANLDFASGFGSSGLITYGATVNIFIPVFTLSGEVDTWGEIAASTTGFHVGWSGTAGHTVHAWCYRTTL